MSGEKGTMNVRDWSETLALGAIVAVFAALSPDFLGARNLSMLAIELSITAILALGDAARHAPGADRPVGRQRRGPHRRRGGGAGHSPGLAGAVRDAGGRAARDPDLEHDGPRHRDSKDAVVHHHAGRPAGLQGAVLARDPQRDGARLSGRRGEPVARPDDDLSSPGVGLGPGRGRGGSTSRRLGAAREPGQARGRTPTMPEVGFLKAFLGAQAAALFVAITNGFRGVPLPAVLLAVSAAAVSS